MRCSAVAIERGEPSWQARSTAPTSMPSSSEAVATTTRQLARLEPLLGVEAPLPRDRLPWCAATALRAEALGEVARHPLDEAARVDEHERGAVRARQRGDPVVELRPTARWCTPRRARRSGTSMARSMSRRWPDVDDRGQRPRRSRPGAAPRPRWGARWPRGRCAAAASRRRETTSASSRSRESARCAPRLSAGDRVDLVDDDGAHVARASARPDSAVSRMKSDSGVVTSTCGGRVADLRAARAPGVSPVRTAVRMPGRGQAAARPPAAGQLAERAPRGCGARRWTAP